MNPDVLQQSRQHFQKVLEVIKNDVATIRTGRATPAVIENIIIDAYGGSTHMRLMELATIAAIDTQTLIVTPFDVSIIQEIAKGIQDANVGLNPVVDSQVIRIVLPPLTQERREELIKAMKHKLENGKIMVRQTRHESMEQIKKLHVEKSVSDDDKSRLEKDVQKLVDETIESIESIGKQKEDELLSM